MSANSKIEWCDHTFNPWIGCTKVSPGCANCYAEASDKFRSWTAEGWGKGKPRKRTSASYWKQPLKWNAADTAATTGSRPRVFCASLADWLDDEVPIEWLADLLALIHATPNLDWLLLTKRPENWRGRLSLAIDWTNNNIAPEKLHQQGTFDIAVPWLDNFAPSNVWLGTSVEDQARADERIPTLMAIPARVRFLSCEPLLGRIDLLAYFQGIFWPKSCRWVIVGGESGPKSGPMHPDWARSLRDQCIGAGVPFFFKQWGGRNKKAAGRLLDGREWNEFPSPRTRDGFASTRDARATQPAVT